MSWFDCPCSSTQGVLHGSALGPPVVSQRAYSITSAPGLSLIGAEASVGMLLEIFACVLCGITMLSPRNGQDCFSTFCKNKYQRERQMERWRPQEAAYYQCSLQFWKVRRQRSHHPVTSLWTGWQSCGTILTIARGMVSQPFQPQLSQSPASGEVLPWRPPFNIRVLCLSMQHSFFPPSTQTGFPFITLIWHESASLPKLHAGETERNSALCLLSSDQHRPFSLGSDD